jgi:1,2-dihydroxy-3-keto-5-methylthiopentene dioxygenase
MARLRYEDGRTETNLDAIQAALAPLAISVKHWPTGDDPALTALLDRPALADDEKERVLGHLDHYFQTLKREAGYQTRDLIVLHADVPNLDAMLAKFDKCHTHDDDEVRYIIDGEGVFGFVLPDGKQVHLQVQAGEYINVPANTEHWFYLTESRRIKAVRYFTSTEGWTPRYTDTEIRPVAA